MTNNDNTNTNNNDNTNTNNNDNTNKLSVEDLKAVLRLIDVVSKRGAIQPIEMSGVGALYEKIALVVSPVNTP